MRHSTKIHVGGRPVPSGWELGSLLALLIVGCVAFGVCYKTPGKTPLLWATAQGGTSQMAATAEMSGASSGTSIPPARTDALSSVVGRLAPPLPSAGQSAVQSAMQGLPVAFFQPAPAAPTLQAISHQTIAKRHVDETWYKGERYVFWKTITMRVTAYAPDKRCCWPFDGTTTASGLSVKTNHGRLVAADTRVIPFHSLVSIDGYHDATPVPVLDRGGAIKGRRLDVLLPTFDSAKDWGSRLVRVKVYRPAKD